MAVPISRRQGRGAAGDRAEGSRARAETAPGLGRLATLALAVEHGRGKRTGQDPRRGGTNVRSRQP
jgi:hypothetical protein